MIKGNLMFHMSNSYISIQEGRTKTRNNKSDFDSRSKDHNLIKFRLYRSKNVNENRMHSSECILRPQ